MSTNIVQLIISAKDSATEVIRGVESGIKGMNSVAHTYKNKLEELNGTADKFKSGMMQIATVLGVQGVARSFVEINASAEKTKLMLAGLMGSTDKAATAFDFLLEASTKAPFSIDAMKDAFVKLQVAGLNPMGGSLQVLTDAMAAFGGSDEGLKRVAVAIQQMAGKGVISMEELRQQLGEQLPTAMKAMAAGMGMSMKELSKEIENGNITATTGLNAMMGKLKEWYGGSGQNMMMSWTGLISNVKVAWEKFMLTLGQMGIFDRLKGTIDGVLQKLDAMQKSGELQVWADRIMVMVSSVISVVTTLGSAFAGVINFIGPVLPAITQLFVLLKAGQLVVFGIIGTFALLGREVLATIAAFSQFASVAQSVFTALGTYKEVQGMISAIKMMGVDIRNAGAILSAYSATSIIAWSAIAFAVGYAIGELINYFTWKKKIRDIEADAVANTQYLKEKLDVYTAALKSNSEEQARLNEQKKAGTISSDEYTKSMHRLTEEQKIMQKEAALSVSVLTGAQNSIKKLGDEITANTKAFEAGDISYSTYIAKNDELIKKKDELVKKATELRQGLKGIDQQMIALGESYVKGNITLEAYKQGQDKLKVAKEGLIGAFDGHKKAVTEEIKTYEQWLATVEQGSQKAITMEKERIKTLEQSLKQEQSALERSFSEGKISKEAYLKQLNELDQQYYDKKVKLINDEIALEKKKGGDADNTKIFALYEERTRIVQDFNAQRLATQDNADKKALQMTEANIRAWETIEKSKLTSYKANLDYQDAMDEAAREKGLLSEVDYQEKKAARQRAYLQAQIDQAGQLAEKIKRETGLITEADKAQYQEALNQKQAFQYEYEIAVINSEKNISAAKAAEATKGYQAQATQAAAIINDETQAYSARMQSAEQYATAEKAIIQEKMAAGIMTTEAGQAAITKIMADAAAKQQKITKDNADAFIAGVGAMLNYVNTLSNALTSTFASFKVPDFSDVRTNFKDAATVIAADFKSLTAEINRFTTDEFSNVVKQVQGWGSETFKQLYLYGKNVTWMSGEQIKDWANRVREYVSYVQNLFQSLKDQINGWKDELDSLRGNELAILDRWFSAEMQKLKDKYGAEFAQTKEYQEAITLLQQLYAEKRKKILDQEAKDAADAQQNLNDILTGGTDKDKKGSGSALGVSGNYNNIPSSNTSGSTTGGSAAVKAATGGLLGTLTASIQNQMEQITTALEISLPSGGFPEKIAVDKNFNFSNKLEIPSFDPDTTRRWANDTLFPMWEEYMRLKGGTT